jgi:hypothetical protein
LVWIEDNRVLVSQKYATINWTGLQATLISLIHFWKREAMTVLSPDLAHMSYFKILDEARFWFSPQDRLTNSTDSFYWLQNGLLLRNEDLGI